jgi:hypothetical protein
MKSRFARPIRLAAVLSVFLLTASATLTPFAQESRGKITGTVTDANKASVTVPVGQDQ